MTRSRTALEIKGRMLSITRVRVLDGDAAAIHSQLEQFARQMPQAVKGMAVVIDSELETDLPAMLETMRSIGMQPLAVSEGVLAAAARGLGLPVVSRDSGKGGAPAPAPEPAPEPAKPAARPAEAAPAPRRAARIVAEPVRSGQQIYAEHGDLVVLNTVSPGAEVIADGCVHVYGKLAGRAIAGARGDESARIFCRKMEAELVAIAGIYAVADQIKEGPRGVAATAYLEQGRLRIEPHKV
jgi:septum site-determining protein MinC